jgi:Cu/Ag efflux pump CusA
VEFSGTAEAQAQSRRDLLVNSLLAGLGILLLLSVVMGNYHNLLLVLLNLPFALVGGVLAALFTGGNLSLGSLVVFVTLFGITLRNSIMLISHYEHLVEVEGVNWGLDAALRGASERLAPILMTALVTGLGLLPLAIGSGDPGSRGPDGHGNSWRTRDLDSAKPPRSTYDSPCAMEGLSHRKRAHEESNNEAN